MASSLSLRSILDTNKLTGPNYVDWLRNLKIVLNSEKLSYILDTPSLDALGEDATEEDRATYKMWQNDSTSVKCIILASMTNELQRQHESMDVLSIIQNLKELYGEQSRTARYEISKQLFRARMTEGTSIQEHVLKIIDLITRLGQLGFIMDGELNQDLILQITPRVIQSVCSQLSHEQTEYLIDRAVKHVKNSREPHQEREGSTPSC